MHFSTIAITLLGAAASASASIFARQSLPDCAAPCAASADLGGCVVSDTHCLCTNSAFVTSTTTCVEKACTGADLQNALKASQDLCAKVGVTLTAPAASSTPAAASSTGSASASTKANSTASSTGSAVSSSATTPTSSGSAPATSSSKASSASSAYAVNALFGAVAAGVVAFAL